MPVAVPVQSTLHVPVKMNVSSVAAMMVACAASGAPKIAITAAANIMDRNFDMA